MNIFVLDEEPRAAARYHCDRHVVKMITESGQLLSTALHSHAKRRGRVLTSETLYRSTHRYHLCAVWTTECRANFQWVQELMIGLIEEYDHRWPGNVNKFIRARAMQEELMEWAWLLPLGPRTPFVKCVAKDLRNLDAVSAYRQCYRRDKAHLMQFTGRERPPWLDALATPDDRPARQSSC